MFHIVLNDRYADGFDVLPMTMTYCIWFGLLGNCAQLSVVSRESVAGQRVFSAGVVRECCAELSLATPLGTGRSGRGDGCRQLADLKRRLLDGVSVGDALYLGFSRDGRCAGCTVRRWPDGLVDGGRRHGGRCAGAVVVHTATAGANQRVAGGGAQNGWKRSLRVWLEFWAGE